MKVRSKTWQTSPRRKGCKSILRSKTTTPLQLRKRLRRRRSRRLKTKRRRKLSSRSMQKSNSLTRSLLMV